MTLFMLDASVFLAVCLEEIGADKALARMPRALMSAVNASEALMRGVEKGVPLTFMRDLLQAHHVDLVPFDARLAVDAALLRRATRHLGLSFADRACIATAISRNATVVTADRAWATLDLLCPVELIR